MKYSDLPKEEISHLVKPLNTTLEQWQVMLRMQQAGREHLDVECVSERFCPGQYRVKSLKTGGAYKVVYRGPQSPWNYCDCMDFKTSRLGTCKHIEAARLWIADHHKRIHREQPAYTSVYLSYRGEKRQVQIRVGDDHRAEFEALARRHFDELGRLREHAVENFGEFLREAQQIDPSFRCYGDALDFIVEQRERAERQRMVESKYNDEAIDQLLTVPLYAYQREAVRFAALRGRAILADDMGLGKTVQALATAELLRREHLVGQVLILCPATLKYQWQHEIARFTQSRAIVLDNSANEAQSKELAEADYIIVAYVALQTGAPLFEKGILADYAYHFDMVVMDEVQRLKNWNTQMARAARRLVAPYTLMLSGTPLENRLEDLYSIVELVDQFLLSPYYLFRDRYIRTDENGHCIGYRNLNELGERIKAVMLRRHREEVAAQLPERIDINLFVPLTPEQRQVHDNLKAQSARLIGKWNRQHTLSESDRKQLMLTLSQMRMVCDSLYVLDEQSRFDTKVEETMNILDQCGIFSLAQATDTATVGGITGNLTHKIVIFSQWERMTRLMAQELDRSTVDYAYVYGNLPSAERAKRIAEFCENDSVRILLSTDTSATGLNLQQANVIINLDQPWNPATLEQRIGRIHRIGQQRNILVYNLIAKDTIEEDMLSKLSFKAALFEGVLDGGEDVVELSTQLPEEVAGTISEEVAGTLPEEEACTTLEVETKTPAHDEAESKLQSTAFLQSLSELLLADEATRTRVAQMLQCMLAKGLGE